MKRLLKSGIVGTIFAGGIILGCIATTFILNLNLKPGIYIFSNGEYTKVESHSIPQLCSLDSFAKESDSMKIEFCGLISINQCYDDIRILGKDTFHLLISKDDSGDIFTTNILVKDREDYVTASGKAEVLTDGSKTIFKKGAELSMKKALASFIDY
ncbi:MAG: hypothetical protein WDK96_01030 [Candidatus Paceibacterota bacterium]|jgi:hypothetical protein